METILHFISQTSGMSFLVIVLFLIIGLYINQVSGKGDIRYIITVLIVFCVIAFKIFDTDQIGQRYHIHIVELMVFPLSFSMIHLIQYLKFTRKTVDILTYGIIVFQLINITRFSLLSLLLPAYQTTFSLYASLLGFYGLWLLRMGIHRKRALLIIAISTFCASISLAKWLLPLAIIYIGVTLYDFVMRRSIIFNVISIIPVISVVFVLLFFGRNTLAEINGYKSFDDYVLLRITKDNQQGTKNGDEVFDQVGGIGDGGRFYVWGYHIKGWLDGNIWTGVDLSFSNPFHYPEHNVFVFYITRLGLIVFLYLLMIYMYLKSRNIALVHKKVYLVLLLYILFLFSVGAWYGVPLACLGISMLLGLFKNRYSLIQNRITNV